MNDKKKEKNIGRLGKKVAKILRLYKQRVKKFCQFGHKQKLTLNIDNVVNFLKSRVANLNREGISYHVILGCLGAVRFWLEITVLTRNLDY